MEGWEKYGNGLPNVIVFDLEIHYSTGKIRAATHGRGIWEADLFHNTSDFYVDYVVSSPDVCLNGPVTYYNRSFGAFDSLLWNFGEGANPSTAKGEGPFTVSYSSLGKKSIGLTGYYGLTPYQIMKQAVVTVATGIDFLITPDNPEFCKGNAVYLYATGGYDVTWYPSAILDTVKGEKISVSPPESVSFDVIARNGTCTATKMVDLSIVSNDSICDAILLQEGLNGPYTNFCATPEENEPVPPPGSTGLFGCESQDGWCDGEDRIDNSLWFKFMAPSNGLVSIETDGFDSQIAVYDAASCDALLLSNYVLLAANDDFPGKEDYSAVIQEISGLVPGKTYWLQVDGSYGGVTGKFTIKLNYFRISSDNNPRMVDQEMRFNIFPNPNNGTFTLDYHISDPYKSTINIYAVGGTLIYSDIFYPDAETGQHSFQLNGLSAGFYIFELICNKKSLRQKFLIKPFSD